jgi:cellulose 1,4-beta-cellobiosidase
MLFQTVLITATLATLGLAAPVEETFEERQACAGAWGQCGGKDWTGATCCSSGNGCVKQNDYYFQCIPGAAATTTTSTSSKPTSTSTSSSSRVSSTSTSASATKVTTTSTGTTTSKASTTTKPPPAGSGTATYSGNPFSGVGLWANEYYASEVMNIAVPSLSGAMATAAAKVADVPSFMWMDTFSKIALVDETLADIRAANKAGGNYAGQFVVYDLPDRDCAAAASNGEYSIANGGVANYKKYIDAIREMVIRYSDIRILLVIEPDSLANMVTNLGVAKCAGAQAAYMECTQYALKNLDLPNVAMYLDAGHAGWLGWPNNQAPAAQMYAKVYKDAGKPKALRGLATNVANYNAFSVASAPPYTQGNAVYDEEKYVHALAPLLSQNGWDAHFIVDQGRSGKQPTGQLEWGNWCNAVGTGFGLRPSANTGDELVDAFVWVKPGGECDGTSDQSAVRYDFHCGSADALKPAPEAGSWFQAYFEQLLKNANPPFL